MMYAYRNSNTDDVVERAERSTRLDRLSNWQLINKPKPPGERPPRSANKADWVTYAAASGMDQAGAEAMTRDQLAAHYYADEEGGG